MRSGGGRDRRAPIAVVALSLAMVFSACGNTATPTGAQPPSTTSGASSQAPSSAGAGETPGSLYPSTATLADMNAREAADIQQMLDELGVAAAIGADAAAVLSFVDAEHDKFAQEVAVELSAKYGIQLAADTGHGVKFARFNPDRTTSGTGAIRNAEVVDTGGLRDQVSGWLGIVGLLIPKSDEVISGAHDQSKTASTTVGETKVDQTSALHLEVETGQGKLDFLVKIDSSTRTATGSAVAILNGTGTGRVKVNSCPGATGSVMGEVDFAISELESAGGATGTSDVSVHATFTLSVNAGAHLSGIRIASTTSGGGTAAGNTWTAGGTSSFGGGGAPTVTSNNATPAQVARVTQSAAYAAFVVTGIAVRAEEFWRSGKCVDMNSSVESKTVGPKEQVTFTVAPRGAWDARPIDAGVDATFTGKESLDPSGANLQPPVEFTYKAGDKKDDKGSVSLTQTSVRGIGKKTITFTVGEQDYKVNYPGAHGLFSGVKCKGLAGPWTLTITIAGGGGTTTFTIPEDLATAPSKTNMKLSVAGTSNTFKLTGTVRAVTSAEGAASLDLWLCSGTLTQQNPNGTGTLSFSEPNHDNIALEVGSFCSGTT